MAAHPDKRAIIVAALSMVAEIAAAPLPVLVGTDVVPVLVVVPVVVPLVPVVVRVDVSLVLELKLEELVDVEPVVVIAVEVLELVVWAVVKGEW